jgi:branched-chain amino acid transport system substrate-binding protein
MTRTFAAIAAAALAAATAPAAQAQDVTIGVLGGITGPIAALAPPIVDSARLALDLVNAQGGLGDGGTITVVVGDSACSAQGGGDSASKVVNVDGAAAIVGALCSGATLAAANTVTIPAGVLLISPASTSPAVTALEDGDTVFRTVPSDSYQGAALARTALAEGYDSVAVTYLNNDYGVGLANAFREEYEAQGGTLAAFEAHEENKASYRSELAALSRSGADTLVIFDYADGSGLTILREALENGFFERFIGGDGMRADSLIVELGAENLDTFVTSSPIGQSGEGLAAFEALAREAGLDPEAVFAASGFDAGFLVALAMEHAGGDAAQFTGSLRAVATAPGEPILPGEWEKAKALIAEGTEIDYKGAAGDHEFDANGDVPGAFGLFAVSGDRFEMTMQMK